MSVTDPWGEPSIGYKGFYLFIEDPWIDELYHPWVIQDYMYTARTHGVDELYNTWVIQDYMDAARTHGVDELYHPWVIQDYMDATRTQMERNKFSPIDYAELYDE